MGGSGASTHLENADGGTNVGYSNRIANSDYRFRNNPYPITRLNVARRLSKSAFSMDFDVEEDDDFDDFDDYTHDEVTYRVRSGDVQHIPQAVVK